MNLIDVYSDRLHYSSHLYVLLDERTPEQSISHNGMPTWKKHLAFVRSRPYLHWYMIEVGDKIVGCCYLSKQREIGISIYAPERGNRYATCALQLMMKRHPGKFLSNVNPLNEASIGLFTKLGFKLLQVTYEKA